MVKPTPRFQDELKAIFDFIARDSRQRANKFKSELFKKLATLSDSPYRCRRSTSFNDESVRDFIFKGYVIPYAVIDGSIYPLGIYKANEWKA